MNLHVLIWAPNYAPVDISALFLSYSAGWSHCLLLDLLWQFQKWTPFEVQHRHSPKKRQWTWSDIPLRQKMPRHIASNIADNIYWSMVTNYSISYEGRNIIPEVLWKYMLPVTIHSPQGFSVMVIYNTGWPSSNRLLMAHWLYNKMKWRVMMPPWCECVKIKWLKMKFASRNLSYGATRQKVDTWRNSLRAIFQK